MSAVAARVLVAVAALVAVSTSGVAPASAAPVPVIAYSAAADVADDGLLSTTPDNGAPIAPSTDTAGSRYWTRLDVVPTSKAEGRAGITLRLPAPTGARYVAATLAVVGHDETTVPVAGDGSVTATGVRLSATAGASTLFALAEVTAGDGQTVTHTGFVNGRTTNAVRHAVDADAPAYGGAECDGDLNDGAVLGECTATASGITGPETCVNTSTIAVTLPARDGAAPTRRALSDYRNATLAGGQRAVCDLPAAVQERETSALTVRNAAHTGTVRATDAADLLTSRVYTQADPRVGDATSIGGVIPANAVLGRYSAEILATSRACIIREDGVADVCAAPVIVTDDVSRGTLSWTCNGLEWEDGWVARPAGSFARGACETPKEPKKSETPVHRVTSISADVGGGGPHRPVGPAGVAALISAAAGAVLVRRRAAGAVD